jgi:6-phosphogluconolactonase
MTRTVRRFPDLDALSRAVADEVAAIAAAAVRDRGRASIALSGGKTPEGLFQLFAARGPDALPWSQVDLWWCDERMVPPSDPASNAGRARAALIEPLGLSASRVHRIAGELADPEAAARAYHDALVESLGSPPILDLCLHGLGEDGHTASLFPDSAALAETGRYAIAARAPAGFAVPERVTLTVPVLRAARRVRFLVAGGDKAEAVAAALEGPRDPRRHPAQMIDAGEVGWRLDEAAASRLREPTGGRSR